MTLVFGGYDGERLFGDTWGWDGEVWTQLFPNIERESRYNAAMAFDSVRGVAVLYGGGEEGLTDTWEWDGHRWRLRANSYPTEMNFPEMAYDEERRVSVLYSGSTSGKTTEWDGIRWTQTTEESPGYRIRTAMVYDSARRVMVMFGGWNTFKDFGDTWQLACQGAVALQPIGGECPGWMWAIVSGATPGGTVAFVFGRDLGQYAIPSGPCSGTVLSISGGVRLAAMERADANGDAAIIGTATPSACGGRLLALDVSTCSQSIARMIE
jgi:hypothetical protein